MAVDDHTHFHYEFKERMDSFREMDFIKARTVLREHVDHPQMYVPERLNFDKPLSQKIINSQNRSQNESLRKSREYRYWLYFYSFDQVWRGGKRGDPGIEPGTSCTLNKNHTTRPIARLVCFPFIYYLTHTSTIFHIIKCFYSSIILILTLFLLHHFLEFLYVQFVFLCILMRINQNYICLSIHEIRITFFIQIEFFAWDVQKLRWPC